MNHPPTIANACFMQSSRLAWLGQFVTRTVDRQYVTGPLRIDLDLRTQVRDVPVEGPVEDLAAVARVQFDQMIAREHLAGMIGEDAQQAVFRRGQLDERAGARHLVTGEVDRDIPYAPDVVGSAPCAAGVGGCGDAPQYRLTRATTSRGLYGLLT